MTDSPCFRPLTAGARALTLPADRFKTARLTAALLLPLSEKDASARALLPFLLRRGCAAYPDFTSLNRRLNELYGARVSAEVARIGETQALVLTAVSLDDRYALEKEAVTAECAALLRSMLFEPALESGLFRLSDVEQERRMLTELIESEINDKRLYARRRCEELTCEGEPFSIDRYGRAEEVMALTPQSMTAVWREALEQSRLLLITQSGRDTAADSLADGLKGLPCRSPRPLEAVPAPRGKKGVRRVTERMDLAQAKLVMGFVTPVAESRSAPEEVAAMRLMNALLGGTPHSLLFRNVREKLSLCYYCASSFDRHKGVFLIDSGVEEQCAAKAEEEILRQLDCVRRGDFTQEDLEAARRSVVSQFRTLGDLQSTLAGWYLGQANRDIPLSPEAAAAEIAAVSAEQVRKAAESLTFDTVYLLAGQDKSGQA